MGEKSNQSQPRTPTFLPARNWTNLPKIWTNVDKNQKLISGTKIMNLFSDQRPKIGSQTLKKSQIMNFSPPSHSSPLILDTSDQKKPEFAKQNKALFLDRDGVVIDYIPYLSKPEQVSIPAGAAAALKHWQDAGYLLIIITNQSGIARGYFTENDLAAIHGRMVEEYRQLGVNFHDISICPHHPDQGCPCRKPSPYLLLAAARQYGIDLAGSFFIGDAPSDLECALAAGCQPVLLLTGRGKSTVQEIEKYAVKIPIYDQLEGTVELLSKNAFELEL
jgi:D-glycero-D-manno-heptose 1,7-bisphosphate phosphatase